MNQPPPQDTFERCAKFPNFSLRLGIAPGPVGVEDGQVAVTVDGEKRLFDFLIAGTGFTVDLGARKELARFSDRIALWSDRYTPPPGEESAVLGAYPYLSANFQFTEKVAGSAPFLRNIFCYTFAAMPSLACSAGISALKFGVERVAAGISRALFVEDADSYLASLKAYDEVELDMSGFDTARDGSARVA
jgi:cation diffusion facilitator CzcD-associated flavoprotein CzcO